jgi:hypothetical protein
VAPIRLAQATSSMDTNGVTMAYGVL